MRSKQELAEYFSGLMKESLPNEFVVDEKRWGKYNFISRNSDHCCVLGFFAERVLNVSQEELRNTPSDFFYNMLYRFLSEGGVSLAWKINDGAAEYRYLVHEPEERKPLLIDLFKKLGYTLRFE